MTYIKMQLFDKNTELFEQNPYLTHPSSGIGLLMHAKSHNREVRTFDSPLGHVLGAAYIASRCAAKLADKLSPQLAASPSLSLHTHHRHHHAHPGQGSSQEVGGDDRKEVL